MVIDKEDQKEMLKHVISDLGFNCPHNKLSSLIDEISARKHGHAEDYVKVLTSSEPQAFEKVFCKIPEGMRHPGFSGNTSRGNADASAWIMTI